MSFDPARAANRAAPYLVRICELERNAQTLVAAGRDKEEIIAGLTSDVKRAFGAMIDEVFVKPLFEELAKEFVKYLRA